MPNFQITLQQEAWQTLTVEVEAETVEEAINAALEDPLNYTIISEEIEGGTSPWEVTSSLEV